MTGGGTLIMSASANSYGSTTLNGGVLGGGGTIAGSILQASLATTPSSPALYAGRDLDHHVDRRRVDHQ